MSSRGRLIFEYRHNGNVTRVEREVGEQPWRDPTPEQERVAFTEAAYQLLRGATDYREVPDEQ